MLKTNEWYCFGLEADDNTQYEVDYLLTGINPEMVDFEARQDKSTAAKISEMRSQNLVVTSDNNNDIQLCWQKKDKKTKKLDFSIRRTTKLHREAADSSTLDGLLQDMKLLQGEVEEVSHNIQKQRDLEQEHFNLALGAASTQTWMSILKMGMVLGICALQIYLITSYFTGNLNKRHQIDPFAENVI